MDRRTFALGGTTTALLMLIACSDSATSSSSSGTSAEAGTSSGMDRFGDAEKTETCTDKVKNQDETDVDCGGTKCSKCPGPTLSSVTPNKGSTAGGTAVTIVGTNFAATGPLDVTIGGIAATAVNVSSATTLTAVTRANLGKAGLVDVVVRNPATGTVTGKDSFRYFFGSVSAAAPVAYPAAGPAIGPAAGAATTVDINGDGKLDFIYTAFYGGTVGVRLGNGDGTFQAEKLRTTDNQNGYPTFVAYGDINGDSKLDLVVAYYRRNAVEAFLGNGDGTFAAGTSLTMPGIYCYSVALADVNGDNKLDILSASGEGIGIGLRLGNGDGTFEAATTITGLGSRGDNLLVSDLNNDNEPDLVVPRSDSTLVDVSLGNGDGTFNGRNTIDIGHGAAWYTDAGDFDNDGKMDLVISDGTDGRTLIVMGNGDGTFKAPTVADVTSGKGTVYATDLDRDGAVDVIFQNKSAGSLGCATRGTARSRSLHPSSRADWGRAVTSTRTASSTSLPASTGPAAFR